VLDDGRSRELQFQFQCRRQKGAGLHAELPMKTKNLVFGWLLLALSAFAQVPQARHTLSVHSDNGMQLQTRYFKAEAGDFLEITVACNFTKFLCMAGSPDVHYADGGIYSCEPRQPYRFFFTADAQEEMFICQLPKGGRIAVNAPGWFVAAQYDMLVQDNSSIVRQSCF
jgi:hypothetical protein